MKKYKMWDGRRMFQNHEIKHYELGVLQGTMFKMIESTGLKDKNDKEIFEGDIVKAYKPNSYLDGVYEVSWHKSKGRWYYKNQPTYKNLYQVGCSGNITCEILGNIYENPKMRS